MKKTIFLAVLFIASICAYGQEAQKGYYITNNNQKVEGYFKPTDFFDVTSLKFKKALESDYISLPADGITEYGIGDAYKFEKHTVDVDASTDDFSEINYNRNPEFVKKTVFLEVILISDATLYAYAGKKGTKFFYKVNSKNIAVTQLVYKTYKVSETANKDNMLFRQQLFDNLKCDNESISAFTKLKYERKVLVDVFKKYNTCSGYVTNVLSAAVESKYLVKYTIYAGIHRSTFGIQDINPLPSEDNKTTFGFGGEVAFILPSRKFEVFIKADYEQISANSKSVTVTPYRTTTITYAVNSSFFNAYIGPRYNFILNDKNKFFVDAALGINFFPGGDLKVTNVTNVDSGSFSTQVVAFKLQTTAFFNFGVGYVFNDRYGVDFRIDTNRNLLNNINVSETTKFTRMGLSLRYTLN